jgi:hypothetical protein
MRAHEAFDLTGESNYERECCRAVGLNEVLGGSTWDGYAFSLGRLICLSITFTGCTLLTEPKCASQHGGDHHYHDENADDEKNHLMRFLQASSPSMND